VVIGALLANRVGCQAVWTRMTESWDRMQDRFPKNAFPRMIDSISSLCADAAFADSAVRFLADHPVESGPRRVAQSIERLHVYLAFAAREHGRLAAALQAVADT